MRFKNPTLSSQNCVCASTLRLVFILQLLAASTASGAVFPILDEECEAALALSAAPKHLQNEASIYVLGKQGYSMFRDGTNPYTCIVQRNHPTSLLPVCFDIEGTGTIVQTILGTSALVLNGKTDTEINAAIIEGFERGEYSEPLLSSVSYMLSDFNWMYDESSEKLNKLGPHSMIFANAATRESILFDAESYRHHNVLPAISGMGPFKYFVIRAEIATENVEIEKQCGSSLNYLSE